MVVTVSARIEWYSSTTTFIIKACLPYLDGRIWRHRPWSFILDDPPILANAKEAFSVPLSTRWKGKDIQLKEMIAVLLALRHWRPQLAGNRVIIYCDN